VAVLFATGLKLARIVRRKLASLLAAAQVAASVIQWLSAFRGSCSIAKVARAAASEAGISDKASSAAMRTCASESSSKLLLSIAWRDASLEGRTIKAARRTPAEGCFKAATATVVALEFESSKAPIPFNVHSA